LVAENTPVNLVVSLGSEPVNVPDAGLAAAIRDQLGLAPATPLTRAHLAALTTLSAYNRDVTDLTGLEHAVNLVNLDLGSNNVAALTPLSGLATLDSLNLSTNLITNLGPLSGLSGLRYLTAPTNQIANLAPLAGMSGLLQLALHENQIADLTPLAGLTGLEALNVSNNLITDLTPLSGLMALESLGAGSNQVASLVPLAGLTALTELAISDNQLTTLAGIGTLVNLEALYASGNALTDAGALSGLAALITVYLGDNQLTGLPDLSALTGLVYLDIRYNQLTDTAALSTLTALDTLDLRGNQLSDIAGLSGLSNLRTLNLSYNRITDAAPLAGLAALQWLSLRSNRLTDATPLAGLSNLYDLNLRTNNLITVAPLVAGAVFTTSPDTPTLNLEANPLLAEVCDTQIPALEARGVTVTHDACTGPVYMPDLSGMTRAEAEAAVEAAGLHVGEVTEVFSDTVPAGYLTDQDPPAGLPMTAGSSVDITVSVGPEGGQLVNVPDANLAAAIRAALSLDPGTPLTTAHLADLNSLGAISSGIADLTGLEYAVNAVYLSFYNNNVSSAAPLAGLTSLRSLSLSMNPVTDLAPLAGLTNLTSLYLYLCGAADITPLAGLVNLNDLNLDSNGVTDLAALSGMTALAYLYVNDNALTSLAPLSGLAALVHLEAHHNRLADVSGISGLTGLGHLNLANNVIQDAAPLAGLAGLNELNLRYNFLTTVAALPGGAVFTAAQSTPYLYLEENPLLPEVCDTQIPALETRGVVVYKDACTGPVLVPDVTGTAQSAADTALADAGLHTGDVAGVSSETVPAGFVISQDPAANTPVIPGYYVDLTVSTGPETPVLVNVPDPNLAAAIRQQLGLDPATALTTAHLASLFWLEAVYAGIADLTGLEYAVNATYLNLGANPITDVTPLGGLAALQSLYLYECALDDIGPLAGLANMTDLILRNNAITDITPLAGMTRIISLYLSDNALEDIGPLSGLTGLIALYLANNHIQDVAPLANLAALNELSLGSNHITSVAALASGTVFTAAASPLPYVEFFANPLLAAACDTEIPALEARGVTVYHDACTGPLYVPDVTGDSHVSATYELTAAGLGAGTVTQVFSDTVPAGFVVGQHPAAGVPVIPGYVVDLTVSQGPEAGQLVNVPDNALAEAIRSQLSLVTGTPLTTAHLASLTDLSAGYLGVADLTGLEYAVNLVRLYVGGNAFTDLSPLAGLSGLYNLGLDTNAITDITPLAGLPHLYALYLGYCDIADVSPLAGLTTLTHLDLNYNEIADVSPLSGLTTLTFLDLNYNEIADVSPLSGLVNLYLLGLSYNRLTDVSPLAGMTKLQSLSVSANFLTTLAPLAAGTAFTEGAPAELYAYENPLLPEVCDTQIPQIEARGVTVYHYDCEGPVYMPDVTGDTLTGAAAEIEAATISLSVVEEAFSATVPAGFIISQFPAAGTPVTPWYPASVTVSTGPEGGQLVNVPDPNLAAAIRTELGLDPGTPLTTAHLATLNSLDAGYSSVADLTGLEYAVNMQYLYVDGNSISTLAPLAGLPNLEALYASDNLLTDISPVASLSGLTTLYLYENGIADASPVSGLTGLTYLNLQSNFLTDVAPMAGLEALAFLGVSGNYLTTLAPLVSGTTFTLAAAPPQLYADNNPFATDVCDTQIPALETRGVTVSHDPCPGSVTVPDVVGMTALAAGNAFTAAGLTVGMQSEYSATVPAGYIIRQSPPAGFPAAPGSVVNAVSSLGPEGGVLVNVPDAALAGAIRDALSLAPGTPLTTAHLASVSYLYADGLGVTDLTGLEWAVNLFYLYMNTNAPADLGPLAGLTGLDEFYCSTCGLSDLSDLAGLVMLRTLSLGDNQISDLSALAGLARLESLDLNYNEVADLSPLAGLTGLTNLYLSDNQVSDLAALAPLTKLMYLGLSNNLITDASPLANLPALEMLALPSNHLTTLAPLVAGTIFTEAVTPGDVYFGDNPFETDVCDTQIPALELRGVTIYHDACSGSVMNPDIVGLTRVGAGTALGLAGLSVGVVTEVSSETVPAGYVISQDPPAGLPVVPGSSVYFNVSTGPEVGVPVIVPDGGLADAIRSLLGLPPATPLTTAHLAALTTITINSAGVTDLTGLEYAVNLTNLYAADNALTSVAPLGGLVNLVNVYLGTNLLTDASPLAGMPVITYLDLGNNQLTDTAPLAGLATLQELGLNFNQLTTLAPLVSGTVFTSASNPPSLYVYGNSFIADVCATQIPALEAAGVTVYDSCP